MYPNGWSSILFSLWSAVLFIYLIFNIVSDSGSEIGFTKRFIHLTKIPSYTFINKQGYHKVILKCSANAKNKKFCLFY